jgi:hypothetical protein
MHVSKKVAVLLIPSLLFGLGAPAWSASSDHATSVNTQIVSANSEGNSLLDLVSPVLTPTDSVAKQPAQNCKASHMYSQHDVVGDPESCVMGHYGVGYRQNFIAPPSVP